jgi:hypothetical protein
MTVLELRQTYDFLTRLHDEFEPLRAQLLARRPYVSLMDALAGVHNEEIRFRDAGLLQSTTVLAALSSAGRSSFARPVGLHCDHCGHDGHVEAFCYRKKNPQAHRSSQGTDATSSGGFERSSAGLETREILMLLRRLVASASSGAIGSVTHSFTSIDSATTSQSSTFGLPSAPFLGTDPCYLDSVAFFHMTSHSAHLSAFRPSYCHCAIHIVDRSPLPVTGQDTLCSDSFYVPDVSLVPDLTMHLMSNGQITDHDCRVILDPDFCYI